MASRLRDLGWGLPTSPQEQKALPRRPVPHTFAWRFIHCLPTHVGTPLSVMPRAGSEGRSWELRAPACGLGQHGHRPCGAQTAVPVRRLCVQETGG